MFVNFCRRWQRQWTRFVWFVPEPMIMTITRQRPIGFSQDALVLPSVIFPRWERLLLTKLVFLEFFRPMLPFLRIRPLPGSSAKAHILEADLNRLKQGILMQRNSRFVT